MARFPAHNRIFARLKQQTIELQIIIISLFIYFFLFKSPLTLKSHQSNEHSQLEMEIGGLKIKLLFINCRMNCHHYHNCDEFPVSNNPENVH